MNNANQVNGKSRRRGRAAGFVGSVCLATAFCAVAAGAFAAPGDVRLTLSTTTPADGDLFGWAVAVAPGAILVGIPGRDSAFESSGSVYVFDAATGTRLRIFNNPAPANEDRFGSSVAAAGSLALVGAPHDDAGASEAGAAYVYDIGAGSLLGTIQASPPLADALFGTSAAAGLPGGAAVGVVGAPGEAVSTLAGAGAVYIFDLATGSLIRRLTSPSPSAGAGFGSAVTLSETQLAVGAPGEASSAGAVHVFDLATGDYVRKSALSTPGSDDRFGAALALASTRLLVGAPGVNFGFLDYGLISGYALGNGATRFQTFAPESILRGLATDFGASLAPFGFALAVGAPGWDGSDLSFADLGKVYLFNGDRGTLLGEVNNPDPVTSDLFGFSAVASGTDLVVGAPYKSVSNLASGRVYVFDDPRPAAFRILPYLLGQAADPTGMDQNTDAEVDIADLIQNRVNSGGGTP